LFTKRIYGKKSLVDKVVDIVVSVYYTAREDDDVDETLSTAMEFGSNLVCRNCFPKLSNFPKKFTQLG